MASLIYSIDNNNAFGENDELIYKCSNDLKRFSVLTKLNEKNVVMGKNTFLSIYKMSPDKFLIDRNVFVLTNDSEFIRNFINIDVTFIRSIDDIFVIDSPSIIGGSTLINAIYKNPKYSRKIEKIYLTKFDNEYTITDNTVTIEDIPENFKVQNKYTVEEKVKVLNEKDIRKISVDYITYNQKNHYELPYLKTLHDLLKKPLRNTRNALVHSDFDFNTEYDCRDGKLPIFSTKHVATGLIIKELLWFIKGQTDNEILQKQNCRIWNGNSTAEFIKNQGLPYKENDLGPIYGFQWRHAGAEYIDCKTDYTNKGIDQLKNAEDLLKNNKFSRRILISAWNVADLHKMNLVPCHCLMQFYVNTNDELCLKLTQRSGDMFLGVPFNVTSYCILLHLMAKKTNLKPGKLYHSIGDIHIYESHREAVQEQLNEKVRYDEYPTISIEDFDDWDDLTFSHIKIENYLPGKKINAPMIA